MKCSDCQEKVERCEDCGELIKKVHKHIFSRKELETMGYNPYSWAGVSTKSI